MFRFDTTDTTSSPLPIFRSSLFSLNLFLPCTSPFQPLLPASPLHLSPFIFPLLCNCLFSPFSPAIQFAVVSILQMPMCSTDDIYSGVICVPKPVIAYTSSWESSKKLAVSSLLFPIGGLVTTPSGAHGSHNRRNPIRLKAFDFGHCRIKKRVLVALPDATYPTVIIEQCA